MNADKTSFEMAVSYGSKRGENVVGHSVNGRRTDWLLETMHCK